MRLIDASEYDLKSGEIHWLEYDKCSISSCRKPIYEISTVHAIPVDKLCELLQIGKEKPYCEICDEIMPEWCNQHNKQPHGKWLHMKDGNADCSVCGRHVIGVYDDDSADRYCRHCGAKMGVEEQS